MESGYCQECEKFLCEDCFKNSTHLYHTVDVINGVCVDCGKLIKDNDLCREVKYLEKCMNAISIELDNMKLAISSKIV